MVREDQVQPSAVDIEGLAQQPAAHGRALDVPAGAAGSPRAGPGGLARLGRLPQGEVGRVPLPLGHAAPFALHLFRGAIAELAVIVVLGHVEVDVALGLVGKALGDQRLREVDDLVDVLGAAGEVVDGVDAQGIDIAKVVGRHLLGQGGHRDPAGIGLVDQLVVNVGDVHDERHVVARVGQVAFDGVEDHRADHVPDVAWLIDGGAAQIDSNLAGLDRLERFFRTGKSAVEANHNVGLWELVQVMTKSEIRNPKSETNSKEERGKRKKLKCSKLPRNVECVAFVMECI